MRRGEILEDAGKTTEALEAYGQALVAIDSLPGQRRRNRATVRLRERVQTARRRLGERPGDPAGPETGDRKREER